MTDGDPDWNERLLFALVLVGGVVVPGFARYALERAPVAYSSELGVVVWLVGYAGALGFVWYRWVRPLDITGPARSE